MQVDRFYVYEHLRADTGVIFYVGKGSGPRAHSPASRSRWWGSVAAKAGGFSVRFVAKNIDEEFAHLVEIERINQLRRIGAKLANMTDGGDGAAGHRPSEETRRKLSAAHRGKRPTLGMRHSTETRLKMSESHRGNPSRTGQRQSAEERAKKSAALKGRAQPRAICPHCQQEGGNAMRRWHFDACRERGASCR